MAEIPRWRLAGEYMEACNCALPCPCVFGPNPVPTEGFCAAALAWRIAEGRYGDAGLDGLDVALVFRTPPGRFRDGGWTAALYLDQRASEPQREALGLIFTGRAGGRLGRLAMLIGTLVGVRAVPFERRVEGKTRSLRIPETLDFAVETAAGRREGEGISIGNPYHATADVLVLAQAARNHYRDFGLAWDNSGRNGYLSTFSLEGP